MFGKLALGFGLINFLDLVRLLIDGKPIFFAGDLPLAVFLIFHLVCITIGVLWIIYPFVRRTK